MTEMEINSGPQQQQQQQQKQPGGATAITLNVEVNAGLDEHDVFVLCGLREPDGAWLEYFSTKGPYGLCALVNQFGRPELSTTMTGLPDASHLRGIMDNMDDHKTKPTESFSRATVTKTVISSELAVRFLRQRGVDDFFISEFLEKVDAALPTRSGATAL